MTGELHEFLILYTSLRFMGYNPQVREW